MSADQHDYRAVIDRTPPTVKEVHLLRRAEWIFQTTHGPQQGVVTAAASDLVGMSVIPDTWCAPPEALTRTKGVIALVGCPKCGGVSALVNMIHKVGPKHKVTPSFQCKHAGCGFHRTIHLDRWQQKTLYAAACERRGPKGEALEAWIEYCMGRTAEEARRELGLETSVTVVAVGEAIGFTAEDRDAKVLIAD